VPSPGAGRIMRRNAIMSLRSSIGRPDPFRAALAFTFAHWGRQVPTVLAVALVVVLSTLADVLIPLYAGRLVDAVATGLHDRAAALDVALWALGAMLALGLVALVFRH